MPLTNVTTTASVKNENIKSSISFTNRAPDYGKTLSLQLTNTSLPPTTTPNTDNDDKRLIIISASICGFILLVVLCLFIIYCCKKRHSTTNTQPKRSIKNYSQPVSSGFVYENPALLESNQDIEVGACQVTKRRDTIILEPVDFAPPGVQLGHVHGIARDLDEVCHDVSIKLMTQWDEIYMKYDSEPYKMMKSLVEDSMEELYINFSDYRGSTLQKFRQGSVIVDIRLKFTADAVEPLHMIKRAVKSGKFAKLEVDKKYFEQHHVQPEVKKQNDLYFLTSNRDSMEVPISDSLTRSQRMESGYGSQYFDHTAVVEKLKLHQVSRKSTNSIESNTSEVGTSHSISPNSCSSTNISIHSNGVEDEPPRREKSLLHGIVKRIPRASDSKHKHQPKMSIPHVALFNFAPQDFRELALEQGELIRVTIVDAGGWVKAVNKSGKQGWVPQNFLAPFDPKQLADTKKTVDSLMYLNGVIDSIDMSSDILDDDKQRKNAKDADNICDGPDETIQQGKPGLFVTIYPNDPTENNELKLELGDLVDVLKTSETGWWKGRCLRTYEIGWFPSHYVQPHTSDLDFSEYLEDGVKEDKGTVSDSEVHVRTLSFYKRNREENGYNSDDGTTSRAYENGGSRLRTTTKHKDGGISPDFTHDSANKEKQDSSRDVLKIEKPLRDAPPSPSIERNAPHFDNSVRSSDNANTELSHKATTTETVEPPCKPVPPKPRKSHLKHTYQNLAAKGKLGSTDSLVTRSTECLATYNNNYRNNHSHKRRNSAEISNDDQSTDHLSQFFSTKPIDRMRPRSFQETPKASFFYLANRYASTMKSAWSFPTLIVSDQVNLSPEDERPYLVPIPRKSRRKSSLPTSGLSKDDKEMLKDASQLSSSDRHIDEAGREENDTKSVDKKKSMDTPFKPLRRSSSSGSEPSIHTVCVSIPTDQDIPSSPPVHLDVPSKPLPPQPVVHCVVTENVVGVKQNKPAIAPKPSIEHVPVETQPKPPTRSSSKNVTKKFIEEQLARNNDIISTSPTRISADKHNRLAAGRLKTSGHFHFSSFESINEETTEQFNNSPVTIEHSSRRADHRRWHSEPHDGSYNPHTSNAVREHLKSIPIDMNDEPVSNHVPHKSSPTNESSHIPASEKPYKEPIQDDNQVARNIQNNDLHRRPPPHNNPHSRYHDIKSTIKDKPPTRYNENDRTRSPDSDNAYISDIDNGNRTILTENTLKKHDKLIDLSSRTSSMQSLTSIASSTRSTSSSKHEQMNLRKAVMDVYGQGKNDLTFKAGSILFELRPRNKDGYCYGLLEDSTQGYYPEKAVQNFQYV